MEAKNHNYGVAGDEVAEEPPPERLQPVLPAGRGPSRAYVLDKQQPSARTQYAPDHVQRGFLILDRAQDQRRDHGIEAPVREG